MDTLPMARMYEERRHLSRVNGSKCTEDHSPYHDDHVQATFEEEEEEDQLDGNGNPRLIKGTHYPEVEAV
jgi:hypothetical protein